MTEKLQKVLARQGLGSRREIEGWIAEGRITIDQRVAQLGDRVTGEEKIKLDGKPVRIKSLQQQVPRVIAYHKDVGTVCSRSDPEGRRSVFEDFPRVHAGRWVLVGRLDINTTGLLLATTDGELANRLMHPRYEIKREYAVRIYGDVTPPMVEKLLKGVELEDGMARFESINVIGGEGKNQWFTVVLHEGRNREVRRLWESQGVQVNRLTRNMFGNVRLPRRLKKGECEELDRPQIEALYASVQLDSPFELDPSVPAGRGQKKVKKSAKKYSNKSFKQPDKKSSQKKLSQKKASRKKVSQKKVPGRKKRA